MPQGLNAEWREALGSDFERIHETWLHRLSNLTLSASTYNLKYQNYAFEKKRTMKDGYLESGLKMNQYIARYTKWGVEELEERAEHLKKQAYELWPFVKTDYAPPEKQFDEYALDDDITFTNKVIVKYRFNGIEREVQSWTEMYTTVLRTLHEKNKAVLNYLADADDAVEQANHIARSESSFSKSAKIDESLYLWINTSTQYKINLLLKFFALFGEDPENLVFVIKESSAVSEDSDGRSELRRNFWTQAIPPIRDASGTFANFNPTTGNTMQGSSGCAGIYYNCIANYDHVRIELYISNSDKTVNKAIFDALKNQRDEVDGEYGSKLKWERMDDNLASKLYDQLDDISITNEADWPRMIEFLSQQITKLKNACQRRLEIAFAETSQK